MNRKIAAKKKIVLFVACAVLAATVGFCAWYISDCYRADVEAEMAIQTPINGATVTEQKNKMLVFAPDNPVAGLIFYPGGKVQYEAYAPLMRQCAERGILCVVLHMPANLAILNGNAANGIVSQFPQVSRWYIGGHSLGGVMAASYAAKHLQDFDGILLLASYSTVDLSNTGCKVLSIYGTNDGVLNRASYDKYHSNFPEETTEVIIDGGCHAYFGNYGEQAGDGIASISRREQQAFTVQALVDWMDGE